MLTRRRFIECASVATAGATTEAYGAAREEDAALGLRYPLEPSVSSGDWQRELVRCATLAANGHNTQPWTFQLLPDTIRMHPDFSRRTPAVDPDDHHLWTSLGCATENLVVAAAALGKRSDVGFAQDSIRIALSDAPPERSATVDAIFRRQCTRTEYDGKPLSTGEMKVLEDAAQGAGVRLLWLTGRAKIESVIEYVVAGNTAQMRDAAFMAELRQWLRFNRAQAESSGDGLYTRTSGNPSLPTWLGIHLFGMFFREKSENDKYAKHLRSSAGVAVLIGASADPAGWIDTGRAYQRFALAATALGVRNAFVNQPVEVPAVRTQFAQWLGLAGQRPDLVVRFGRGPLLPYSLRRPVGRTIL